MLLQAIKKDWTRVVTHLNILKTYLYILHVEERKSVYNSSDNHDDWWCWNCSKICKWSKINSADYIRNIGIGIEEYINNDIVS